MCMRLYIFHFSFNKVRVGFITLLERGGGGGGGLTQKCRTCMGIGEGGCFRDPKHKSNMYTFVQQRGGVHILSRITKV